MPKPKVKSGGCLVRSREAFWTAVGNNANNIDWPVEFRLPDGMVILVADSRGELEGALRSLFDDGPTDIIFEECGS